MNSMTGFGKGGASNSKSGISFAIEISAVNRKQLEIRAILPRELACYEPLLRKLISDKISRGAISARVDMAVEEDFAAGSVKLNRALLESLTEKCREMQSMLKLSGDIQLRDLLAVPGVLEQSLQDFNLPEIEHTFIKAVEKALAVFQKMRRNEGAAMKEDLSQRLNCLKSIIDIIEREAADIPEIQKAKILEKLKNAQLPVPGDDDRILREIIIYADKSDVTEEITRLRSHFQQAEGFLDEGANPVGRSLDFLMQEMGREITTIGNKAMGRKISPLVVNFKTELEKIREQVQNIE
jgi:uncharacterized protein (TIGR00255 family)